MPRIEYATILNLGNHEFFKFVTLVEHTKDKLQYTQGWEVERAFYGYYESSQNVVLRNAFHDVEDVHNITEVSYDDFLEEGIYDVTHIVQDLWANRKTIRPKRDAFGDPCFSQRKMLFVALRQVQWIIQELEGTSWRRTWSFQHKKYYYYNTCTGEVTWSLPVA